MKDSPNSSERLPLAILAELRGGLKDPLQDAACRLESMAPEFQNCILLHSGTVNFLRSFPKNSQRDAMAQRTAWLPRLMTMPVDSGGQVPARAHVS